MCRNVWKVWMEILWNDRLRMGVEETRDAKSKRSGEKLLWDPYVDKLTQKYHWRQFSCPFSAFSFEKGALRELLFFIIREPSLAPLSMFIDKEAWEFFYISWTTLCISSSVLNIIEELGDQSISLVYVWPHGKPFTDRRELNFVFF